MVTAVPCKAAAAAVMAPVVMPAVVCPSMVIRSAVRAPISVAVPAAVIPGVVPGPAAVPERIAPAPAVPGVIPPGIVPGVGITPGGVPAVGVAGTPPRVVPGIVPAVVIYINGIGYRFGLIKAAEPCLVCLAIVKGIYIGGIMTHNFVALSVAVGHHGDVRALGTAVDIVVIDRRIIIAGRPAGSEPERREER